MKLELGLNNVIKKRNPNDRNLIILKNKHYENNGSLNKKEHESIKNLIIEDENDDKLNNRENGMNEGGVFEMGNGTIGVPAIDKFEIQPIHLKMKSHMVVDKSKSRKISSYIKWGLGAAALGVGAYMLDNYLDGTREWIPSDWYYNKDQFYNGPTSKGVYSDIYRKYKYNLLSLLDLNNNVTRVNK